MAVVTFYGNCQVTTADVTGLGTDAGIGSITAIKTATVVSTGIGPGTGI